MLTNKVDSKSDSPGRNGKTSSEATGEDHCTNVHSRGKSLVNGLRSIFSRLGQNNAVPGENVEPLQAIAVHLTNLKTTPRQESLDSAEKRKRKIKYKTADVPKNIKNIQSDYEQALMAVKNLNDKQIRAVSHTWMFIKNQVEKIGAVLFIGLFEKHADFRDAFASFRGKGQLELSEDPALQAHGLRVLGMVEKIISRLHRIDLITEHLLFTASKHSHYVPSLALVPCVGEQILDAIKPILEKAELWTREAETGWFAVFTLLSCAMKFGISRTVRC